MLTDPQDTEEAAVIITESQRSLQSAVLGFLNTEGDASSGKPEPVKFMLVAEHELILRRETMLAYQRGEEHCEVITEEVVVERAPSGREEVADRVLATVQRLKLRGEAMLDSRAGDTVFGRVIELIEEAGSQ